jgi:hypothetical protein
MEVIETMVEHCAEDPEVGDKGFLPFEDYGRPKT